MNDLDTELRSLIAKYGLAAISSKLREIRGTKPRQASKRTAFAYVHDLVVPDERKARLLELASLFDTKQILPTLADARNFLESLGARSAAIRARPASVPIVFSYLASLPDARFEQIVSDGSVSGPSRLGPIADAIKANSRSSEPHD
jgi:hypothetical protein